MNFPFIANKITFIIFIIINIVFTSNAHSKNVRFSVSRDVWISAYPGEENYNMGASSKLKLKGIQDMAVLDFDLSELQGKKIDSARLYLRNSGNKNRLRKIGISTVASPWVEGKSRGYFVDFIGHGATFRYSSYKRERWAGETSDLTDVTMGRGNTWQHHTELEKERDGWWSVDIAPELIYAMATGKSYGLLIMDESGQTFANNYVFSGESKYPPYIIIDFSEAQKHKPLKPDVGLITSFDNAHMKYGAVVLRVLSEEGVFAFDMFINDKKVPLWRVPKPGPVNTVQEIIIDWLTPEEKVDIKITAINKFGQRSDPAFVTGYASGSLPEIAFQKYLHESPIAKRRIKRGVKPFRVWAVPDVTKIDPVTGHVFSETNIEGFDMLNPVWSENKKEITLSGIKGETIAFQLCVENENQAFGDMQFKLTSLTKNKKNKISDERFSLYQVHYVEVKKKWYPELAIPMQSGRMNKKILQGSIKKQRNQLVYIDLHIPSETEPGLYTGEVIVLKEDIVKESLNISLKVEDISMPVKLSFVPELNMYKGPGTAGTAKYFQAHRIAHEHRTVINRVPYSQDGKVHSDMIPEITYSADGRIKIDWSDYDERVGPLFDGSAFTKGDRKGIPVEKFYLPFFEGWPTALASNYDYDGMEKKTKETISHHALQAPSLDEALTSEYMQRFSSMVDEFRKHFTEKGWDRTEFQFYLNNKWHWDGASSWWNLDEPMSYDDWEALKFFGSIFRKPGAMTPDNFVFRADISRPRWQHDWLNGILDKMYVQDRAFYDNPGRVRQLKKEGRISFSIYGSLNNIESSNQQTVLWCMSAFVEGADGVLPWQSLGNSKALTVPDRNALIVDVADVMDIDWIASLRVNALRRCQQNVELLAMLENKYSYKREQIRDFYYGYFKKEIKSHGLKTKGEFSDRLVGVNTAKIENFRKILIDMLSSN